MTNNLEKLTIRLSKGDKDKLNQMFPALGHTKVIRTLVRNHIKKVEEQMRQQEQRLNINPDDINL